VLILGAQYPAVIIPFTHVDPEKDTKKFEFTAMHEADTANHAKCKYCHSRSFKTLC
jgi:hypothetical protein